LVGTSDPLRNYALDIPNRANVAGACALSSLPCVRSGRPDGVHLDFKSESFERLLQARIRFDGKTVSGQVDIVNRVFGPSADTSTAQQIVLRGATPNKQGKGWWSTANSSKICAQSKRSGLGVCRRCRR
jgi:citrate lyase beta subunit